MKTFLALLVFVTLARADDAQTAIKAIETENHVKFVREAPINGSNRTQWIFAAPDTANGIRIRIHVISHPSRLEYLSDSIIKGASLGAEIVDGVATKRLFAP